MATISKCQTASGATLYRVRYRAPERGQTDKRGFKTKRDAEIFAASVEVKKMTGEYIAPSLGRITVGELAPDWLARTKHATAPALPDARIGVAGTRRTPPQAARAR